MDQPISPRTGHAVLAITYAAGAAGLAAARSRRRQRLPMPGMSDVILLGLATYRLSRVVSRDKVMDFVRAPVTEVAHSGSGQEVVVKPKGTGMRRALGELVACPFCLSVWIATALGFLFLFRPRAARSAAAIAAAVTVSDATQYAMEALRRRAE